MNAPDTCMNASAEVRLFCETVSDSTTSSITLLRAIEKTVGWLSLLQSRAKADNDFAYKATEHIKICERVKPIDADGTICAVFEQAEESLGKLYQLLITKRESAIRAPELQGEHKESVVEEYTAAIGAIADLHNSMADLRWAFGEHDADLEKPTGKSISNREELKAYLQTL